MLSLIIVYAMVAAVFFLIFYYDKFKDFNPFLREYYLSKERVINYAASDDNVINYDFAEYLHELLKDTLKRVGLFKINITRVPNNEDSIAQTNYGNVDLGVATEYELDSMLRNKDNKIDNLRYVCSLYDTDVVVLADNSSMMFDLNDTRNKRVHIGIRGSTTNKLARKIMSLCGINEVTLIETDYQQLIENDYGTNVDAVFLLNSKYNDVLLQLTNKVPSHLLSIKSLNNGNVYSKTIDEIKLYRENPYIHKKMLSYIEYVNYYPKLSRVNERQDYIPSIKTRYVLFAHKYVEEEIGYNVLKTIHSHLNSLNSENFLNNDSLMSISYSLLPLKTHNGVLKYYKEHNIISELDCIHYYNDAVCKEKELTGRLVDINIFNNYVY